jgi:hypothetical protein
MTVRSGEERYADLIRAYWLARGYIVEPYVASTVLLSRKDNKPTGHSYQAVRSNMVGGLPHPSAKLDAVKVNYNVVGDDSFLLKGKPTTR